MDLAEIKKAIEAARTKTRSVKKKQEIARIEEEVDALETLETDVQAEVSDVSEVADELPAAPQEQVNDPVIASEQEVAEVAPVADDRSAFNCPDCKGLGLLPNGRVDGRCAGTGKI